MDADFSSIDPCRQPNWRCARVLQLVDRRLRPSPRCDDHYVRAYHQFVLSYLGAGDEKTRSLVALGSAHLYKAHQVHHDPNLVTRDILQAYLLTGESSAEIARRMDIEAPVVEYYERLFFNVQDRLEASTWIAKAVLGLPWRCDATVGSPVCGDMNGNLLRIIAYYAGPVTLDAILNLGISNYTRGGSQNPTSWFGELLGSSVTTRAIEAALSMELNRKNAMRFLKLAMRLHRSGRSTSTNVESQEVDQRLYKFFQEIGAALGETSVPR
jgi:hypothetical protein